MKGQASNIKTYDTKEFRNKFFNKNSQSEQLFNTYFEDFFCLRIETIMFDAKVPIPPAKETAHSILLVTEGNCKMNVSHEKVDVQVGEVLLIQAGKVFSLDEINPNLKGFSCHFNSKMLLGEVGNSNLIENINLLNVWNQSVIKLSNESFLFLKQLLIRIAAEHSKKEKANVILIQTYIITLLLELKSFQNLANEPNFAAQQISSDFKKIIFEELENNLKVSGFAQRLNISPNHLNKSVKLTTGKSASELITEIKLSEAKYLLYQTDLSISEIAAKVGYFDASYFSRIFKKYEKATPLEYKKMIDLS